VPPRTAPVPLQQRFQDARVRRKTGGNVHHRDADAPRLLRAAGDRGQPGLGLDEQVVGLPALVRSGPVARDGAGHQLRMRGAELAGIQPEPRRSARREVLDEHVGPGDQPPHPRAVSVVAQVDDRRLLAAVQPDEIAAAARGSAVVPACEVPSGRSSLMTRAPASARRMEQSGAATACSRATTNRPSRALRFFMGG